LVLCAIFFLSFFISLAATALSPLSLHDALPICSDHDRHEKLDLRVAFPGGPCQHRRHRDEDALDARDDSVTVFGHGFEGVLRERSEEHTSELQSRFDLVCRLLLEKKNNKTTHAA